MRSAYLIIARGDRDRRKNLDFFEFLKKVQRQFPERIIQGVFLQFTKLDISGAIAGCVRKGAGQVFVLPMMYFGGRHIRDNIPAAIRDAKAKYPELDFHYSSALSTIPRMRLLVKKKQ
ncbi:MAG: CbiX/SirB N-terminal domain-containing protein [Candidatus Omnitrophica bacterium]|nr:CbiX/SirB N-terminal domain-containing protein [Candidatus Omnitrophota bacterium]